MIIEVRPNNITIEPSQSPIYVEAAISVQSAAGNGLVNRYRILASAFSGTSGATGRGYSFPSALGTKHIIAVGAPTGSLTILDSAGYTVDGAALTIQRELFDDEVVIVWL